MSATAITFGNGHKKRRGRTNGGRHALTNQVSSGHEATREKNPLGRAPFRTPNSFNHVFAVAGGSGKLGFVFPPRKTLGFDGCGPRDFVCGHRDFVCSLVDARPLFGDSPRIDGIHATWGHRLFAQLYHPGSVGGDLIKAVFVAHRRPDRRIEALASIGVDRVMGLTALLIVVSLSLLIFDVPSTDPVYLTLRSSVLIATPIGLVGLAALTFGGKLVDRMLEALRKTPLVGPGLYRICEFVRIFNVHRGTMLVVLVMSAVVHAGLIVSVDLIARALFERPPSFKEHLVIVPASLAATALPVTPAGLGVMEGCMEYLYRVIPTPALDGKGMGTLVALVYDFSRIVLAIVGVIFYWTAGREVRDSIEAVESEEETETLTNEMAPNKSMDGSEETETPYSPPQFQ